MVEQKAQIGDKVKIVSVEELKSLYSEKENLHTLNALTYISEQDLIGVVKNITEIGLDLWEYTVQFGILTVSLYDSDFDVIHIPVGELYEDIRVYLCIDYTGGMYDRLCFGNQALIDSANASIDTWNTDLIDEDKHKRVYNVTDATCILNADEFCVVEIKPNSVYVTENYIVTDCDTTVCSKCNTLIHHPYHIWNLIRAGKYNKMIIDLSVDTEIKKEV